MAMIEGIMVIIGVVQLITKIVPIMYFSIMMDMRLVLQKESVAYQLDLLRKLTINITA